MLGGQTDRGEHKMKRTLAIVVLCMLLLATVGTTAAVANQAGKSPVYQFDVMSGNTAVGKLTVNTKQQTFVFNGHGLTPGETYYLYDTSQGMRYVGSGVANNGGNVHIEGAFPTAIDVTNAVFTVVANAPPTADFEFAVDSTGTTVTFTDRSTDLIDHGGIASWSWTFGDQGTSSQPNPTHTYTTAGTYTVTLTVTDNDGGATASISKSVTVAPNLQAVLTADFQWRQWWDGTWYTHWDFDGTKSIVPTTGTWIYVLDITWRYEGVVQTYTYWSGTDPTIPYNWMPPDVLTMISATLTIKEILPNGAVGQTTTTTIPIDIPYPHP
jgi:PKD repeat protein